jgi:hypothetical protein
MGGINGGNKWGQAPFIMLSYKTEPGPIYYGKQKMEPGPIYSPFIRWGKSIVFLNHIA